MLSMDQDNVGKDSPGYIGKLRSNFVGTGFVIFDKGVNPKDAKDAMQASMNSVRQELGCVLYESNVFSSRGPRKMTAVIPTVRKDGSRKTWKPLVPMDSIMEKVRPSLCLYLDICSCIDTCGWQ